MEDQKADLGDHAESLSDKTANQGARPGGEARGGITPKPGDPSTPRKARARSAALNTKMRKAGFGDHKGTDLGKDGTDQPADEAGAARG